MVSWREVGIARLGAKSRDTLATFVKYFVLLRAQRGHFSILWYLAIHTGKVFQGMVMLHEYSWFSFTSMICQERFGLRL